MELEYEKFPDFYKQYAWEPEEEVNVENFTGREYYLRNFWRDMANLVGKGNLHVKIALLSVQKNWEKQLFFSVVIILPFGSKMK